MVLILEEIISLPVRLEIPISIRQKNDQRPTYYTKLDTRCCLSYFEETITYHLIAIHELFDIGIPEKVSIKMTPIGCESRLEPTASVVYSVPLVFLTP